MSPKKNRAASAAFTTGTAIVVSPNPVPIGTTRVDFHGTGFPASKILTGTVLGRAPSFECFTDSNGTFDAAWRNENAPLGVGVVNTAEMHSITVTLNGEVLHTELFEVV